MAKFDPFGAHLLKETRQEFEMTFVEIEDVIKSPLPPSAKNPNYWGNFSEDHVNSGRHLNWLNAGYKAFLIRHEDKVRFKRNNKV